MGQNMFEICAFSLLIKFLVCASTTEQKALDSAQLLQNLFRIIQKTMRVERVVAQPQTSDEAFPSSTAPHDATTNSGTPSSQVGATTLANHGQRRKLKRVQIELKSAEKLFHRAASAAKASDCVWQSIEIG